jgi:hypothetical protein
MCDVPSVRNIKRHLKHKERNMLGMSKAILQTFAIAIIAIVVVLYIPQTREFLGLPPRA